MGQIREIKILRKLLSGHLSNRLEICLLNIPLERKCVREDPSGGNNVKNRIAYRIYTVTAYAWVLSDTFSNQLDIVIA